MKKPTKLKEGVKKSTPKKGWTLGKPAPVKKRYTKSNPLIIKK